jgi:Na+/H+ antiporter NhaC
MIGTVWAGGAVSDIISPLSAQMSDTSFGNHLTTSFPYLIAGVVITTIAYVVVGFFT